MKGTIINIIYMVRGSGYPISSNKICIEYILKNNMPTSNTPNYKMSSEKPETMNVSLISTTISKLHD